MSYYLPGFCKDVYRELRAMLRGNITGMDLCGVKHLPDAASPYPAYKICTTRRPDKQSASGKSRHSHVGPISKAHRATASTVRRPGKRSATGQSGKGGKLSSKSVRRAGVQSGRARLSVPGIQPAAAFQSLLSVSRLPSSNRYSRRRIAESRNLRR